MNTYSGSWFPYFGPGMTSTATTLQCRDRVRWWSPNRVSQHLTGAELLALIELAAELTAARRGER
jgi:hypothetical protein